MTITFTPEQERIIAKAIQQGLIGGADDAAELLVENLEGKLSTSPNAETAEEWIVKFNAWADSHSSDNPPLSDEAISRESIYGDRGF